ncbi:MAG: formylglycine-generating enzyme family protein, partial [Bacteroidales bacterium]|nr:formylglycine-generating enzyme family protein [Bacteroidales bacterium]
MKKLLYCVIGIIVCLLVVLLVDGCGDSNREIPEVAMVYVEGGTFMMGATKEQGNDAWKTEKPVHKVSLDGFYIGQYEVTQAQWKAVMGMTLKQHCDKISYERSLFVDDNYPMYFVSWEEATEFCTKLSELTGKKYRLPTEAEWEYAARGGQKADGTKYAGSNSIDEVAWYDGNSFNIDYNQQSDFGVHKVGQKLPNGLGLYDMSGNVGEWCQDWFGNYNISSADKPRGP